MVLLMVTIATDKTLDITPSIHSTGVIMQLDNTVVIQMHCQAFVDHSGYKWAFVSMLSKDRILDFQTSF